MYTRGKFIRLLYDFVPFFIEKCHIHNISEKETFFIPFTVRIRLKLSLFNISKLFLFVQRIFSSCASIPWPSTPHVTNSCFFSSWIWSIVVLYNFIILKINYSSRLTLFLRLLELTRRRA